MLEYKKSRIRDKVKHSFKLITNALRGSHYFKPYIGFKKYNLIIYDDIFPSEKSLFRFIEFNYYISAFKNTKVLSTGSALRFLEGTESFNSIRNEFLLKRKDAKVYFYKGLVNFNTQLLYCVFLSNAYRIIDLVDYYKIPFVFTLYPGGGFRLHNEQSDIKLKRILESPNLKKVIVTQRITLDYLLAKGVCSKDKISYIFGVVGDVESKTNHLPKQRLGSEKHTFDICFVAAKYTPLGIDKGYDTFIAVAKKLVKISSIFHFHVVGGFNSDDIDISEISNNITFYGFQNINFLNTFFKSKDLILSPNIPFQLADGAFDGFPLGTCIEASLNGVAIMACDELNQNDGYINEEEIIIIKPHVSEIVNKILIYKDNYSKLLAISEGGRKKTLELYSHDKQLNTRYTILKEFIK
ncbi:glycosyltransferase family 4 protein [Pontibacter qinzhouensis]|uniref:Glycosyltransferase family 4 protein n=1 Tax=Pontibacter qinzhouensis TaxID=2603253 RepID=A0A5C8K942_9BACT|nr:glycosyltransferase [Pontibacter qinzhouensis]TXK46960.1 glycosyltransferase family 4 protein [Pontibacter qinzhouensis]